MDRPFMVATRRAASPRLAVPSCRLGTRRRLATLVVSLTTFTAALSIPGTLLAGGDRAVSIPVGVQAAGRADPPAVSPVRYALEVAVDFGEARIDGRAVVTVMNRSGRPVEEVPLLLYRLLRVASAADGAGRPLTFTQDVVAFDDRPLQQVNHVRVRLRRRLAPGDSATVAVTYGGYLAGYVETGSLYIRDKVDEAFTILRDDAYAHPLVGVPSYAAMRSAARPRFDYEARITVPETHTVANGGTLIERTVRDGRATFVYRNTKPAWRMDFAIAKYAVAEREGQRVIHFPEDSVGARRVLDTLVRTLELYTQWFGPLRGGSAFTVIEIPDGWGSQADVTSILQTAAAFREAARSYELYHEVSHLWNVEPREPLYPRWDEGLATYLQYLTAERLEGRPVVDAAAEGIIRWLRARLEQEPRLREIPLADYGKAGLTDFAYTVGMLMFRELHRRVGDEAFREIVGGYYARFHATGGSTADFVRHADDVVAEDLRPFFETWLFGTGWVAEVMR
jgi:hypothetical protein